MIVDCRVQGSGLLDRCHDFFPAATQGIAQSKRVQATRSQLFQAGHVRSFQGSLSMDQGALQLAGMDRHLGQVPLRLCQSHRVTARFGNPPCLFQQPPGCRQVERLLCGQDRQSVEGGALHCQLARLPCVREHLCIGRPRLLPLRVQFICPPQVDVEMLDLRCRKHGQEARPMHSRSQQMLSLLVEGEGITHGKHPHRLIACY